MICQQTDLKGPMAMDTKWCGDRWGWIRTLVGVGWEEFKLHRDGIRMLSSYSPDLYYGIFLVSTENGLSKV